MAIERIEQYGDVLKVFTKKTKQFPQGMYFYVDSSERDLIESFTWSVKRDKDRILVRLSTINAVYKKDSFLHQVLAMKYLNYKPSMIDHINLVAIDNVDKNLNIATNQQNQYNRPVRGYIFNPTTNLFQVPVKVNGVTHYPYKGASNEFEACLLRHTVDTDYLSSILDTDYYIFDFLKYRAYDLDILDLERTGAISQEEATYRHVRRYVDDNPWYVYRYGLEEYCKDNHIVIPNFTLDEQGFMIHPITGQRFCPYI